MSKIKYKIDASYFDPSVGRIWKRIFDLVLVEGIMRTKIYKAMLMDLYESFQGNVFAYYYDLSFEEMLRRHSQRKMSKEFGAEEMAEWWLEDQIYLDCLMRRY